MEFIKGGKLSDVWPDLGESDFDSIIRQIVQLEAKMMSILSPAGAFLCWSRYEFAFVVW